MAVHADAAIGRRGSDLSGGAIAGIVVGAVAAAALCLALAAFREAYSSAGSQFAMIAY